MPPPDGKEYAVHGQGIRLHNAGGDTLLPPKAFLPSDERDAAMAQLDRWVINRTLKKLAAAQGRGEDPA
jgi:EAL domain-containing protein (putative c-di-GMP-specific phosphodiesterase class I)